MCVKEKAKYISCYHGQHCQPTRGFQLQDIQGLQQGRLQKIILAHHPVTNKDGPRTRCTCTNTLSIVALAKETVDTTNWECKTSFRRSRLRAFASCSFSSRFSAR